ncbi:MAG: hypothetical protein ACRD36_10540, partial [Candidatus Acidiferrum sp.]
GQLRREAELLVASVCQSEEGQSSSAFELNEDANVKGHVVVGAVRTAGQVRGRVLQTRSALSHIPEAEFLRQLNAAVVMPFLEGRSGSDGRLRTVQGSAAIFQDARTRLPPAAHNAVDALENLCDQRRQLDEQSRIHFWLHNWLWIHLPLSVMLIVLMFAHAVVAVRYW